MSSRAIAVASLLVILFATAEPALAEPLAYVRTSSQKDRATSPPRYHALNLLDENPATVWCEDASGMGEKEEVRFYFKGRTRIDRIVITPAVASGRFIQEIRLSDETNNVRVELGESKVDQMLSKPLIGTNITLTIQKVGAANKASTLGPETTCLADVLLYERNELFGGKLNAEKLRYDPMREKILGRWAGEPFGAPEKYLTFSLDGTWEWTYEGLIDQKKAKLVGEYRFRGDRLLMRRGETGRWSDMRFVYKRIGVDPDEPGAPKQDYDLIALNDAIEDNVRGEYNNADF
ncbi:MAG: hypothetical protein H7Z43_08570 [Clostridia bacterium]|nr:hypothetical protein [Deltaproteobacteria bacterium]